ncbi:PACE efflux transporter [Sneathiella sp.]|jgi:uncharacterized membrane protein|uniref:PACE efflux transporter n=1 Tax=Sneathiella sp. TaxID=1964365 RepID=UPI0039E2A0F4
MRTFWDRVRHTVLFELIAISVVAVIGGWVLGRPVEEIGALGIMMSALAMVWNMLFNYLFDLWDRKFRNLAPRTVLLRIIHAVLFEAGMFAAGLLIIIWWLQIGVIEAVLLDAGFAIFFLVYAFVYNLIYDQVFPRPAPSPV